MVRSKREIKKIDDTTSRQVTFAKRRKGLFKKSQELSTLCDAEIGLIVFSSTSKLYHFSSSRLGRVIQRYMRQTGNLDECDPSFQLQQEDCAMLRKELADKTLELRLLEGEDIEGLDIEELSKLERKIERSCHRVRRMKDVKLHKVIKGLKQREDELIEYNEQLKIKKCEVSNLNCILEKFSEHIDTEDNNTSFDPSLNLRL